MKRYEPKTIEPKWQKIWDETNVYTADLDSDKPKYIGMSMFNYPSGAGIHIGHAMNYTISDVKARMKRQQGYESYHPVGWDSFGLPAENYAIKAGVSPQESMGTIIPNYHKQYKAMGWSNDWEKEIASHRPEYYKWTQWIFSEMYRAGLAYQEERQQWWCDQCQTVLANEQVIDGKCWRHDGADDPLVEKKGVNQWFFKITEYADELLDAIDDLDWTEAVKTAQRNWIGRSEGAEISFDINGSKETLTVFTTRPDTIYGATFMVVAPESELVDSLVTDEQKSEVDAYRKAAALKSEVERQASKEKTGVFTGSYAINPATEEKIPIWVADYVLGGYGTGAIMAVPAHDERDYEFAKKQKLPVIQVVAPVFGVKRENEIFADGGAAIAFDPNKQKYAAFKIKGNNDEYFLPAGGLDEKESRLDCILRELAEEVGLTDIESAEIATDAHGRYYHRTKEINRFVRASFARIVLKSSKVDETALEEHESGYTLVWVDPEVLLEQWEADPNRDFDHYIYGLKYVVARNIELGIDKSSNKKVFTVDEVNAEKDGKLINSVEFDGLDSKEAQTKIVDWLAEKGKAEKKINYKMRDWSVSRQRYWGAPIPIVHCEKDGAVLIPDDQLPVVLPELEDFAPSGDGRSALARATDWLKTTCPECGGEAERETDTLDTYICSSWYMLRYLDPHNQEEAFTSERANKWMPIDFYNGGDHATAHMLYARFITRFFTKQGRLENPEPFKQFLFNGKVRASDGSAFSKSKGNGVDPLEIINSGYGADALRVYLMFAGPLEFNSKWDPDGVPGAYRFLARIYSLVQEYLEADKVELSDEDLKKLRFATHSMIKKVTEDIEQNSYNTAIAALMKNSNDLSQLKQCFGVHDEWRASLESLVMCIAPFTPHTAEELWQDLGHSDSIHKGHWPQYDESALAQDSITLAVQVNGKVRAEIKVAADADEEDIKAVALEQENVVKHLDGKDPKKVIYVKGRLVSVVV